MDINGFKYGKTLEKKKGCRQKSYCYVHEIIQTDIIIYDQWRAQMLQTIQKSKSPANQHQGLLSRQKIEFWGLASKPSA